MVFNCKHGLVTSVVKYPGNTLSIKRRDIFIDSYSDTAKKPKTNQSAPINSSTD